MTQAQAEMLVAALARQFDAEVEAEPIGGNGRFRFAIVSPQFAGLPQLQRQDAIWQVVDGVLPREATLDVSMILAFEPGEFAAAD